MLDPETLETAVSHVSLLSFGFVFLKGNDYV
jgi:hypothetical protein